MRFPILCFDLDGTIMKTDEGVVIALKYAADKLSIKELPYDHPEYFIGPSNVTFAMKTLGLDIETAYRFDEYFVEKYSTIAINHSRVYDGFLDLLRAVKEAGCRVFVCTAKNEEAAIKLSKVFGFAEFAEAIIGAIGGADEKYQLLQRLIDRYNLDPNDIAMIGDRFTDLEGGKHCKTHTVGVLYGYGLRDELEACDPDYIAETVEDLKNYLIEDNGVVS